MDTQKFNFDIAANNIRLEASAAVPVQEGDLLCTEHSTTTRSAIFHGATPIKIVEIVSGGTKVYFRP